VKLKTLEAFNIIRAEGVVGLVHTAYISRTDGKKKEGTKLERWKKSERS